MIHLGEVVKQSLRVFFIHLQSLNGVCSGSKRIG